MQHRRALKGTAGVLQCHGKFSAPSCLNQSSRSKWFTNMNLFRQQFFFKDTLPVSCKGNKNKKSCDCNYLIIDKYTEEITALYWYSLILCGRVCESLHFTQNYKFPSHWLVFNAHEGFWNQIKWTFHVSQIIFLPCQRRPWVFKTSSLSFFLKDLWLVLHSVRNTHQYSRRVEGCLLNTTLSFLKVQEANDNLTIFHGCNIL